MSDTLTTCYHTTIATWLRFADKPEEPVRDALKQNKFKWSAKREEWWLAPPATTEQVRELLAPLGLVVIEPEKQPTRFDRTTTHTTGKAAAGKTEKPVKNQADKLRKLADGLQKTIDAKLNPGVANQNPTPKRLRQAQHSRDEGYALQRLQTALRNLAAMWDTGMPSMPYVQLVTKDAISMFVREDDQWPHWNEKPLAVFGVTAANFAEVRAALLQSRADVPVVSETERKIAELEQGLYFAKIPGFHSTPPALAARMVDLAELAPGMRVLEPSAGKGNIAEQIRSLRPDVVLEVAEWNYTLREILKLKGFDVVGNDCLALTTQYDRICANPPFEQGADIDHVMHCYGLLSPGGRLVALMSEGSFSRSDKKASAFQAFLEERGIETEKLPPQDYGRDHGRTTGVHTRLVVIDKE